MCDFGDYANPIFNLPPKLTKLSVRSDDVNFKSVFVKKKVVRMRGLLSSMT